MANFTVNDTNCHVLEQFMALSFPLSSFSYFLMFDLDVGSYLVPGC